MKEDVDYSKMKDEEFQEILEEIVNEEGANILSIGDVYSELSEHFNNDVLDRWAERNPDKAYPDASKD